jgi:transcriptional regulator with XRE-family HTH domain
MAPGTKKRRTRTTGVETIQSLENLYFTDGYDGVKGALARKFESGAIDTPFWLSEAGKNAYRTDVGQSEHLRFESFSPPPLWQAPYAISLAHFTRREEGPFTKFIYHGIEEILVPIEGTIQYRFFHSRGKEPPQVKLGQNLVADRSIIRVNPQLPHSTAAVTREASAWMVFRDSSNATARLVRSASSEVSTKGRHVKPKNKDRHVSGEGDQDRHPQGQRVIKLEELAAPGAYSLIAWNIAELVRNARLRSALSLEQLGKLVGMDRTSLSRLERADLNIRLDRLITICNELDLDISASILAGSWTDETKSLPKFPCRPEFWSPLVERHVGHVLRTFIIDLEKGRKESFEVLRDSEFSTWIALRGRAIVDVDRKSLVVNEGSVLHFRHFRPTEFESRDRSDRPRLHADWQGVEHSRFLVIACDHDGRWHR